MRSLSLRTVLALILASIFASEASAQSIAWEPPADYMAKSQASTWDFQPLSDPSVASAVAAADRVWVAASYPQPCAVSLFSYVEPWADSWLNESEGAIEGTVPGGVVGRGTMPAAHNGECNVYIDRAYLDRAQTWLASGSWLHAWTAAMDLCRLLVHERGHNLNYGHDPGILGDTMEGGVWDEHYPACVEYADGVAGPPTPPKQSRSLGWKPRKRIRCKRRTHNCRRVGRVVAFRAGMP